MINKKGKKHQSLHLTEKKSKYHEIKLLCIKNNFLKFLMRVINVEPLYLYVSDNFMNLYYAQIVQITVSDIFLHMNALKISILLRLDEILNRI